MAGATGLVAARPRLDVGRQQTRGVGRDVNESSFVQGDDAVNAEHSCSVVSRAIRYPVNKKAKKQQG